MSLTAAHADALERALWIAIRTLTERLHLKRTLSARYPKGGLDERVAEDVKSIEHDIELLKQIHERI